MTEEIIFNLVLFLLGSCLASFFILVGSRRSQKESIIKPGSHCNHCQRPLKYYELIPVFSWLFLKGRCRSCQTNIPVSFMLIEFFSGVLLPLTYHLLSTNYQRVVLMSSYYLLVVFVVKKKAAHKIKKAPG